MRQDVPVRRPVAASTLGLTLIAVGVVVLLGHPAVGTLAAARTPVGGGWVVLLGGLVGAGSVWGRSKLAAMHLVVVGLLFGLTDVADPSSALSALAITVLAGWILLFAGVVLVVPRRTVPGEATRALGQAPRGWHLAIAYLLSGTDLLLARSGRVGLQSQLETGISAAGLQSLLVSVAPLFAVLVVLASVVSMRTLSLACGLLLLQAIASASSGFRGAVLTFLAVGVAGLIIVLPAGHPWRSRRNLALVTAISFAVGVGFFWVGSVVRNQVATAAGFASAGTQVVTPGQFIPYALRRASMGAPLEVAVAVTGAPPPSVTWSGQAMAMLPRAVFPAKPIVSYGTDVAHHYFGETGNSASSLTWLGDAWVNGGPLLVALAAAATALTLTLLERRIPRAGPVLGLPLAIVLVASISAPEGPLPLTAIGLVRSFLVLALLWGVPLLRRAPAPRADAVPTGGAVPMPLPLTERGL